jgi:hypothetical protein
MLTAAAKVDPSNLPPWPMHLPVAKQSLFSGVIFLNSASPQTVP